MTDHANELRRHARKIPPPQGETPGVMLRAADEIERLQKVIASPHNMTRDDIIRMAGEAGLFAVPYPHPTNSKEVERFAALIAAAEREACKRALNELRGSVSMFATSKEARAHNNAVTCCVEAIRAQGNQ